MKCRHCDGGVLEETSIESAVAQGAPMFNSGHHAACAQVYEKTLNQMMTSTMDPSLKHQMQTVLTSASHQHCATERAWTLRHGIDQQPSSRGHESVKWRARVTTYEGQTP